jgi:hypothetical protein
LQLGGFPEPCFGSSEVEARRWSRDDRSRLVREEVTSLERIQDLGNLELLAMRLPELVGSPLSIHALREDLPLGHETVASWLRVRELRYFRDTDGREVDFAVTEFMTPILGVGAKASDVAVDRGLRYLHARDPGTPASQVSASGSKDDGTPEGIRAAPAIELLRTLARAAIVDGAAADTEAHPSAGGRRTRTPRASRDARALTRFP